MRFLALLLPVAVFGSDFFETKIRPVMAKNCYACHSAQVKQPLGKIQLDNREAFLASSVVVPGKPEESRLYRSLTYAHSIKMPPSGALSAETLADFRTWIESGAEYPASVPARGSEKFWAFTALRKPPLPQTSSADWLSSPIDAFLLRRLEKNGEQPPALLDKRSLLRRLSFDLTGLPPTPAEVDAFLADDSPAAYSRAVDRLLGSPHYGERWARHWLDLVRYAETNGHEYDNDKLAPWRYRDYVIRAFNADLPYDQFLREHIAGDLLPKQRLSADGASRETPLATAFYYFGEVLNSCTDSVKCRADEVDNQIDVIGKTFSGLTVACARCHDHKFDPIPTKDYYALAGILHSTYYREISIDSPARAREIAALAQPGAALLPTPSTIERRPGDNVYADFNGKDFAPWRTAGRAFGDRPRDGAASSLSAGAPEFVGTLTSPLINMSDQHWLHVRLSGSPSEKRPTDRSPLRLSIVCGGYKARHIAPESLTPKWVSLKLVLERNRSCYLEIVDHSREAFITVDEIVFSDHEQPPATSGGLPRQGPLLSINVPPSSFAVAASDGPAHDVRVHLRGSHQSLGETAPRRALTVLSGDDQPSIREGSGRLELAERLADPRNPLTARVLVNRVWKHHFGEGLVKSTDNFGLMGERPRDQELLDYLSSVFIESGWSVKSLHRLILNSSWYRSTLVAPRRLEAEAVRDNLLAVSGRLDRALFGPSIVPYIAKSQNGRGRPASGPLDGEGRRSIYTQVRRNFIPHLYLAFDFPSPTTTIGVRGNSAVPSQALLLLNNEFVHEQARLFARSVLGLSDPAARLEQMYLRAFARPPSPEESQRIAKFLAAQSARSPEDAYTDLAHVLFNSPEFVYVR